MLYVLAGNDEPTKEKRPRTLIETYCYNTKQQMIRHFLL